MSAQKRSANDDWEDITNQSDSESHYNSVPESLISSRTPPGSLRSPRKRRILGNSKKLAVSSKRQTSAPPDRPTTQAIVPDKHGELFLGQIKTLLWFFYEYAIDVLSWSLHFLRKPIALFLFIYFLGLIFGRVSNVIQASFRPLCILPGMSSLNLCSADFSTQKTRVQRADYPKLIDMQSNTFSQLLESSVGGSALSLRIKKVEMAASDLVALVKLSDLKSKDRLADSLTSFIGDAQKTARGLTKLNSKFGGTVDQIVAVNDYALQTIGEAQANRPKGIGGMVGNALSLGLRKSTDAVILETFEDAMSYVSTTIQRLILDAEEQEKRLSDLEEGLSLIQAIVAREDSHLSKAKAQLLSLLWTKLGGNRMSVKSYNQHIVLLGSIGEYRKRALDQVVMALHALRTLSYDMEDLRERGALPELAGSRIPVEVHMRSIQAGIERLKESRIKAKSLEDEAIRQALED